MAYVMRQECAKCGKPARAEVRDRCNASRGFFCGGTCLREAVTRLVRVEQPELDGKALRERVREVLAP